MTTLTSTIPETELTRELVKQIRAKDTYGVADGKSADDLLAPFIITKEQQRKIPIVGDPDEETIGRVKVYFNALCCLLEKQSELMAIPMINLTHEGFGRGVITVGKLVVHDRTLRDVHRFGFATPEKLEEDARKILTQALENIEQFRAVAEA